MAHHPTEENRLFATPVDALHCHLSWSTSAGWTVNVSHRHEGQLPERKCTSELYERLTIVEALQVVEVSAFELLPWLEMPRPH